MILYAWMCKFAALFPWAHEIDNVRLFDRPVAVQFEKKSFEAHAEKERLKKENFELRKENDKLFIFQLETKVERLTSQVEALKCDPILLEIREVLCNLEEKVVDKISQDPENTVFLSQVTLDEVAIEKWHTYCGLHRADLYAFSTMLQTIALARIKVAHPTPKLGKLRTMEDWTKESLRKESQNWFHF